MPRARRRTPAPSEGVVYDARFEMDFGAVAPGGLDLRERSPSGHKDGGAQVRTATQPGPHPGRGCRPDAATISLAARLDARVEILLNAPRILNEPVRWKCSGFTNTGRPMTVVRGAEKIAGVGRSTGVSRCAACSMSSSPTTCFTLVPRRSARPVEQYGPVTAKTFLSLARAPGPAITATAARIEVAGAGCHRARSERLTWPGDHPAGREREL